MTSRFALERSNILPPVYGSDHDLEVNDPVVGANDYFEPGMREARHAVSNGAMTNHPAADQNIQCSGVMDLFMISNFGASDGGRETWAYNFIPRLLDAVPTLCVNVFGLRRQGELNNSGMLGNVVNNDQRLRTHFFCSNRSHFPLLTMLRTAPLQLRSCKHPPPDLVLAVGSALELSVISLCTSYRKSAVALWLRNILWDEKSHRIPTALRSLARYLEIILLRRADVLIANGEDTADYYRARGLDVVVIPNSVDFEKWYIAPAVPEQKLRVALIGRLTEQKGAGEFLELSDRVGGKAHIVLHVVGSGPFEAEFRNAAKHNRVQFHGAVPNAELPELLSQFDVCVALTHKSAQHGGSGVSNALLEQMAAGRVIVAWDNAIFRQLLNESNAFLVPQGDTVALEKTLNFILDNPAFATERANAAQLTARCYSFDAHIAKFLGAAGKYLPDEIKRGKPSAETACGRPGIGYNQGAITD